MAYDQLGMAVGGAMQEIGMTMWRDKRAQKAFELEQKARTDQENARYNARLAEIEAAELSKAEREAAREAARAEREAERDARKFEHDREMEAARGQSREKAAGIRASRPVMAREPEPKYDRARNTKTGKQRYIQRGEELGADEEFFVPRGDRRDTKRPVMADMEAVAGPLAKMATSFAAGPRGTPAPAAPSGAPKPGDVMDGFQFMGGDPADPNAWKKL